MLEYTLEITTFVQPTELLPLLFDGAQPQADEDGWTLIQPGFTLRAVSIAQANPLVLQMGVASNLRLVLSLSGMVNYAVAMSNILNTVMRVLEDTQGNLVFYVAEVDVLLWRKSGELFLNQASNFWSPSFLNQIHWPYTLQEIKPLVAS